MNVNDYTLRSQNFFCHIPLTSDFKNKHILRQSYCYALDSLLKIRMSLLMPKKQAKSNQNWKQIEFVNIQLDIKQKKEFRSWYETMAAEAETLLDNHIKSGYKISIRYDEENETFISSSTCVDEGLSNHDKCLTSRSDVLVEALLLNIYKTDVVCKDGVWEADTSSQKWG